MFPRNAGRIFCVYIMFPALLDVAKLCRVNIIQYNGARRIYRPLLLLLLLARNSRAFLTLPKIASPLHITRLVYQLACAICRTGAVDGVVAIDVAAALITLSFSIEMLALLRLA